MKLLREQGVWIRDVNALKSETGDNKDERGMDNG